MRTHRQHRGGLIAFALMSIVACGVGCAAIAGLDDSAESKTTSDAGNNNTLKDATTSAEASSGDGANSDDAGEDPDPTFQCGTQMTCVVDASACCVESPTVTKCEPLTAGCPTYDAGSGAPDPDGGPPGKLLCTTYKNCLGFHDCCWDPKAGSMCQINNGNCPMKQESLCLIGLDTCGGTFGDCQPLPNSPQSGIGHCKPKGPP
jgi:hypothetical protein